MNIFVDNILPSLVVDEFLLEAMSRAYMVAHGPNRVIAVHEYREVPEVKEIAHGIKQGDAGSMEQAASEMAQYVNSTDALVPIPNHGGRALTTLELANRIASKTGCAVYDILSGLPRETLYSMKAAGKTVSADMIKMSLSGSRPASGKVILVDNVYATGTTATAALEVIPDADLLVYAVDSKAGNSDIYEMMRP